MIRNGCEFKVRDTIPSLYPSLVDSKLINAGIKPEYDIVYIPLWLIRNELFLGSPRTDDCVYIPLWLIRNKGGNTKGRSARKCLYPSLVDSKPDRTTTLWQDIVYIPLWLIRNLDLAPVLQELKDMFISLFG